MKITPNDSLGVHYCCINEVLNHFRHAVHPSVEYHKPQNGTFRTYKLFSCDWWLKWETFFHTCFFADLNTQLDSLRLLIFHYSTLFLLWSKKSFSSTCVCVQVCVYVCEWSSRRSPSPYKGLCCAGCTHFHSLLFCTANFQKLPQKAPKEFAFIRCAMGCTFPPAGGATDICPRFYVFEMIFFVFRLDCFLDWKSPMYGGLTHSLQYELHGCQTHFSAAHQWNWWHVFTYFKVKGMNVLESLTVAWSLHLFMLYWF